MSILLNKAAAVAAIASGAGFLMADAQESAPVPGMEMTCADLVTLDTGETERILYFLAGMSEARTMAAMHRDIASTAANLPPSASDSTDPDSRTDPLARKEARERAMALIEELALSRTESSDKLPPDAADWPNPNVDWSSHVGDGHTLTVEQIREAERLLRSAEVRARIRSMAAERANAQPGSSAMPAGSARPAVDPTVTAGVDGGGAGRSDSVHFYRIPVEMVVTDCRATPDASLVDIIRQHRN